MNLSLMSTFWAMQNIKGQWQTKNSCQQKQKTISENCPCFWGPFGCFMCKCYRFEKQTESLNRKIFEPRERWGGESQPSQTQQVRKICSKRSKAHLPCPALSSWLGPAFRNYHFLPQSSLQTSSNKVQKRTNKNSSLRPFRAFLRLSASGLSVNHSVFAYLFNNSF